MPKSGTQELQGPLYNIPDNTHHFNEILKHVSDLKEMRGPVYTLEREHHFNEIEKHVSGIQQLQGPVYDCIANHHFQEIIKDVDKVGIKITFFGSKFDPGLFSIMDSFFFTWLPMFAKYQDLQDHISPTFKLEYLLNGYRYQ